MDQPRSIIKPTRTPTPLELLRSDNPCDWARAVLEGNPAREYVNRVFVAHKRREDGRNLSSGEFVSMLAAHEVTAQPGNKQAYLGLLNDFLPLANVFCETLGTVELRQHIAYNGLSLSAEHARMLDTYKTEYLASLSPDSAAQIDPRALMLAGYWAAQLVQPELSGVQEAQSGQRAAKDTIATQIERFMGQRSLNTTTLVMMSTPAARGGHGFLC